MSLEEYFELYKISSDVNSYYALLRKKGDKRKKATIKRQYYKVRKQFNNLNNKTNYIGFDEYTTSRLKQLKLEDFKRMKIKLTEKLLKDEGFTFEEREKILGKTEVKKFEVFEEEVLL